MEENSMQDMVTGWGKRRSDQFGFALHTVHLSVNVPILGQWPTRLQTYRTRLLPQNRPHRNSAQLGGTLGGFACLTVRVFLSRNIQSWTVSPESRTTQQPSSNGSLRRKVYGTCRERRRSAGRGCLCKDELGWFDLQDDCPVGEPVVLRSDHWFRVPCRIFVVCATPFDFRFQIGHDGEEEKCTVVFGCVYTSYVSSTSTRTNSEAARRIPI
jgi:hypothetical protein